MTGSGFLPFRTVSIVGVGLIGGSVGLALRERRLANKVVGIGRRMCSLEKALEVGAVDEVTLEVEEGVREAELAVLATPVGVMEHLAVRVARGMPRGGLLTDVGSTKGLLARQLQRAVGGSLYYVGSHPMAGSEKRGVGEARADLFEGALCFVTPTEHAPRQAIVAVRELWEALGARVRLVTPAEHDRIMAVASHLPHLVAAALVNLATPSVMDCAGSGFRDTTRIASGDPRMWTDVCMHNRERLLEALRLFRLQVDTVIDILEGQRDTELRAWLQSAKALRDHRFNEPSGGPGERSPQG